MQNLPEISQRVRVWPAPGRKVQLDHRPVASEHGGRYLAQEDEGTEIIWSSFALEQLRAGDIYLHDPRSPAEVALALEEAKAKAEAEEPPMLAADAVLAKQ